MIKYFFAAIVILLYTIATASEPTPVDTNSANTHHFPIEWKADKAQFHKSASFEFGFGLALPRNPRIFKERDILVNGYVGVALHQNRRLTIFPKIGVYYFPPTVGYYTISVAPGLNVRATILEIGSTLGLFGCAGGGILVNMRYTQETFFQYQFGIGVALHSRRGVPIILVVRDFCFRYGSKTWRMIPITVGFSF